MVSTTVAYGAMELQQSAHRFWVAGLLISIAIHSAVLGAFHLPWFDGAIDASRIRLKTPELVSILPTPINIPGTIPLPPPTGTTAPRVRSERAMPVPVPDETADPTKEMATQEQFARAVEPVPGTGEAGEGTGSISVQVPPDDTPVPFEAVERLPVPVTRVAPEYPALALKAGMEGRVVVKMLVGKDGSVREAMIERSTADVFNDAALAAARGFLFTPAVMNNGPVPVWITVPFTFRLK